MAFDDSIRSITLDADASLAVYTGVSGLPGSPADHGGHHQHDQQEPLGNLIGQLGQAGFFRLGAFQQADDG